MPVAKKNIATQMFLGAWDSPVGPITILSRRSQKPFPCSIAVSHAFSNVGNRESWSCFTTIDKSNRASPCPPPDPAPGDQSQAARKLLFFSIFFFSFLFLTYTKLSKHKGGFPEPLEQNQHSLGEGSQKR